MVVAHSHKTDKQIFLMRIILIEVIKMIKLYIRYECPFCQKVLKKLKELDLEEDEDFELIEAGQGTPGRGTVLEVGGRGQVPFMIDGDTHMYESDDIIDYIVNKFKD